MPAFVNVAQPSAANLHLLATDTVAQDHGATVGSFSNDIDGDVRPQGIAWDIGAHEVTVSGGPTAPALVSVDVVP